ncbi:MAG: ComEC/Rec2 family competence protein [Parcubacteria group bacterium]|nr:ComEC/Rec2 family competence protein [Parcubacteria group bacterium]
MRISRLLFFGAWAFIGGVALSSAVSIPFFVQLLFATAGVCFLLAPFRDSRAVLCAVFLVSCLVGIARHTQAIARENLLSAHFEDLIERQEPFAFSGTIVRDPEERKGSSRLVVAPKGEQQGLILLTTNPFTSWHYGETISVQGKLQTPAVFEDFNYRRYLAKDGVYAVMYYPTIASLGIEPPQHLADGFMRRLFEQKTKWKEMVRNYFSPPESGILAATLLADKSDWSDDFSTALNRTGLTHVTAISGQHITIFSAILLPVFLMLGLWKKQATLLVLAFVILFIVVTGFEASAIRAGIMGTLGMAGTLAGRRSDSIRALAFAGAVMLALNPLLLSRDVGFQLSFLAVLGILWCHAYFRRAFARLPEMFGIRDVAAMTIAAQLFTLPIIISNFGFVSLVSPITNILIGPIAPLLVGAGLVFLLAGNLLGSAAAFLFSLPLIFLLSYFSFVAEAFSRLPFAAVAVGEGATFVSATLFAGAGLFVWRTRKERMIYW